MTKDQLNKEIMSLTEWEGSFPKNPIMDYKHKDEEGLGCEHDEGFFCEHRASYIIGLIDKHVIYVLGTEDNFNNDVDGWCSQEGLLNDQKDRAGIK